MADVKVKHKRCLNCNALAWRTSGQLKIIADDCEVGKIARLLQKEVNKGDILCNKCRKVVYQSVEENIEQILNRSDITNADSQSSDVSHQESENSTTSSFADPSYVFKQNDNAKQFVEMPFPRVTSSHRYCFICSSSINTVITPFEARQQVFKKLRIFIPKGNRCCRSHLIRRRFFEDELPRMYIQSTTSFVEVEDLNNFIVNLSIQSDKTITDKVGDFSLSEERLEVFTGLNWESLIELRGMMTSMRNSQSRDINQAIVVFLFKLRTGNSNALTAAILGLEYEQQVSKYVSSVIKSFEKDILPFHFGFEALSRQNLIGNETSIVAKKLYDITDQLVLIFDGTYVHHEKSTNNQYQRRSYSGQKKKHLCKPFTIVTTNGYVVESLGPFNANQNDAQILKHVLEDSNGLKKLMKVGDVCVVDRGFRDIVDDLTELGYRVLMPALKGKRNQLTTAEANESRRVTKVRWVIEAIHGIIGRKYRLLHHQVDNKLLPKVSSLSRIACFLNNKFGKRLNSDVKNCELIVSRLKSIEDSDNTLAQEVAEKRWSRRKVPFKHISSSDVGDFPEMTTNDLEILFTGSYQLSQAVSYLAELMNDDNTINMSCVRETLNILKVEVKSRHVNRQGYKCFIEYTPNSIGYGGIRRYCCECANGKRTIGCCSHIAAIIYYLSHARYLSRIIRPAETLSKLFIQNEIIPVINEESDDD